MSRALFWEGTVCGKAVVLETMADRDHHEFTLFIKGSRRQAVYEWRAGMGAWFRSFEEPPRMVPLRALLAALTGREDFAEVPEVGEFAFQLGAFQGHCERLRSQDVVSRERAKDIIAKIKAKLAGKETG